MSGEVAYATFPRRLMAVVVDVLVLVAGVTLLSIGGVTVGAESYLWLVILIAAGLLLYEPLLVSIRGGTVGHYACNLHVAREADGQNLGFFAAFARMWIKSGLGILSFFFMGLTRRHQAFHDLATKSSVRITDRSRARPSHYVLERNAAPGDVSVGKTRRVLVMVGYAIVSFVGISIAAVSFVSESCALNNVCTEAEEFMSGFLAFGWMLFLGLVLLFGWRGELPGARSRRNKDA